MPAQGKSGQRAWTTMELERVASPTGIAAVADLARAIWPPHYAPIIGAPQVNYMLAKFQSPEAIARQIASEGYEYYLAPHAGYLALVPDPAAKTVLLSKIYVVAAKRGTGLGRQMAAFAERRGAELGCETIWLTVNRNNRDAIAFYARMGFRQAGKLVTDIGGGYVMDDWRMEKTIRPQGDLKAP